MHAFVASFRKMLRKHCVDCQGARAGGLGTQLRHGGVGYILTGVDSP